MDKEQEKIFVKDSHKTYGLMEIVDGTSPMVEKAPRTPWTPFLITLSF